MPLWPKVVQPEVLIRQGAVGVRAEAVLFFRFAVLTFLFLAGGGLRLLRRWLIAEMLACVRSCPDVPLKDRLRLRGGEAAYWRLVNLAIR